MKTGNDNLSIEMVIHAVPNPLMFLRCDLSQKRTDCSHLDVDTSLSLEPQCYKYLPERLRKEKKSQSNNDANNNENGGGLIVCYRRGRSRW